MSGELINLGISKESQENVIEVYGESFFEGIIDNIYWLKENIKLFSNYNLDYDEVFSMYPELLMENPKILNEKLKLFIQKLGINYQLLLDEDLSLYEELSK